MPYRFPLIASALTALLVTAASAEVEDIRDIDVTMDLAAIQSETAATYWSSLEADLEAAIAVRVTNLLGEEGSSASEGTAPRDGAVAAEGTRVLVDIRELELSTAFERNLNLGDAILVAQVNVVDDEDNSNADAYELSVSLENAGVVLAPGQSMALNMNDRVTYQLLVDAFADALVSRLK